jgi:hypothetical protein
MRGNSRIDSRPTFIVVTIVRHLFVEAFGQLLAQAYVCGDIAIGQSIYLLIEYYRCSPVSIFCSLVT